jgi:1-phosphatidylinositol-4-phosphate 5-kinase
MFAKNCLVKKQIGSTISFNSVCKSCKKNPFMLSDTIITIKTKIRTGSASTPAHNYSDFKLKVYASYGFRYMRKKFNVSEVDFMVSVQKKKYVFTSRILLRIFILILH